MNPNSLEAQLRHNNDVSPAPEPVQQKKIWSDIKDHTPPTLITLVCGFFIVRWIFALITLLLVVVLQPSGPVTGADLLTQVGPIFLGTQQSNPSALIWVLALATVVGVVGIWLMYRWALIIYGATTIALIVMTIRDVMAAGGGFNKVAVFTLIATFLVNVALVVIGSLYFKRMK